MNSRREEKKRGVGGNDMKHRKKLVQKIEKAIHSPAIFRHPKPPIASRHFGVLQLACLLSQTANIYTVKMSWPSTY